MDNINLIKPLLKRENDKEFYVITILARKKDVDWMTWNNRMIKEFYIFSMTQLDKVYDDIIKLCDLFKARAYIRLSRRNSEHIVKDMLLEIWNSFKNNSYNHLRNIYSTTCWRNKWLDKIWIVDIDDNILVMKSVAKFINTIVKPIWDKILATIPTKNWIHLITKPFDLKAFNNRFCNIDVHKNNPTVLYCWGESEYYF